jgi:two-component system, NarL family, sensor histidine kinase DegS
MSSGGRKEGLATPLVVSDPPSRREAEQAGVEEEVRRLVARELHDRVAQTLTGMLVDVENFKSEQVAWQDVVQQLDLIQSSTRQVLSSIRQLLHDLRGEEPLGGSFVDAVHSLLKRFEEKTGIRTRIEVAPGWPEALTGQASLNLFRIIEEALANIRMHSGAQAASIVLGPHAENELGIVVSDDGRGVDTDPARPVGLGTIGMGERAMFLGGHIRIESEDGRGTVVRAVFPKDLLVPPQDSIIVAKRRTV